MVTRVAAGSGDVSISISLTLVGEVPSSFVSMREGDVPVLLTLAGGFVVVPSSLVILMCFMGDVCISIPFKMGRGEVPSSLADLGMGDAAISTYILLGMGEVS